MERGGYIRLHRKIKDCKVLQEPGKVFSKYEAWIDLCLDEAQGVDRNGLKRGEFEASHRHLARKWNWSKSKVERFMADLQSDPDPMIMRVGQSAGHFAGQSAGHFIICKYERYNPTRDSERDTSRDSERDNLNKDLNKEKERQKDTRQAGPPDPRVLFEIFQSANKKLPQVKELTPDRRKKCLTRINQAVRSGCLEQYLKDFKSAVEKAQLVPFLCGEGERRWRANFDWFVENHTNMYGVIEGKYGEPGDAPKSAQKTDTVGLFDSQENPVVTCKRCEDSGRIIALFVAPNGHPGKLETLAPWSEFRETVFSQYEGKELRLYRCSCGKGEEFLNLEPWQEGSLGI